MNLVKLSIITVKNRLLYNLIPKTFKKLILILETSMVVTEANKKDIILDQISYIYNFV